MDLQNSATNDRRTLPFFLFFSPGLCLGGTGGLLSRGGKTTAPQKYSVSNNQPGCKSGIQLHVLYHWTQLLSSKSPPTLLARHTPREISNLAIDGREGEVAMLDIGKG